MTNFIQKRMFIRLTFVEPILAATPGDKEIYSRYVGNKAPDAKTMKEELEDVGLNEMIERGTNVFLTDKDGNPYLSNHVIKGFFKESAKSLRRVKPQKDEKGKEQKNESSKMSAYLQKIDTLIKVYPRKLKFKHPDDLPQNLIEEFQRPLRASTPQGERVALANSEMLPEDTTLEFEIQLFDETHEPAVREWLDYGFYHGLGQWRNADFGCFEWEEISEETFLENNKLA